MEAINVAISELKKKIEPQLETVIINNLSFKMEIDSGADVSAISKKYYDKFFSKIPIRPSKIFLRAYDKQKLPAIGYIQVEAKKDDIKINENLYIIEKGGKPILGRIWLHEFGMWPLTFEKKITAKYYVKKKQRGKTRTRAKK